MHAEKSPAPPLLECRMKSIFIFKMLIITNY